MSTRKVYDLSVVVGTYKDGSGQQKNRYKNIGVVLEKDDGGRFILLDRDFNPAGVPFDASKGENRILVSLYEPRQGDGQQSTPRSAAPAANNSTTEDDIPFE